MATSIPDDADDHLRDEIDSLATKFDLSDPVRQFALRTAKRTSRTPEFQEVAHGSPLDMLAAASVFYACRVHGAPVRLAQISEESPILEWKIEKMYHRLKDDFDHEITPHCPPQFVPAIADTIDAPDQMGPAVEHVLDNATASAIASSDAEMHPACIAAGAFYAVATATDHDDWQLTTADLADAVATTKETVTSLGTNTADQMDRETIREYLPDTASDTDPNPEPDSTPDPTADADSDHDSDSDADVTLDPDRGPSTPNSPTAETDEAPTETVEDTADSSPTPSESVNTTETSPTVSEESANDSDQQTTSVETGEHPTEQDTSSTPDVETKTDVETETAADSVDAPVVITLNGETLTYEYQNDALLAIVEKLITDYNLLDEIELPYTPPGGKNPLLVADPDTVDAGAVRWKELDSGYYLDTKLSKRGKESRLTTFADDVDISIEFDW